LKEEAALLPGGLFVAAAFSFAAGTCDSKRAYHHRSAKSEVGEAEE